MFCDLVDSTRLASMLDPEDLRRILLVFREACIGTIEACGGTIGQYLGDAVLAYFGFPRAREDDPCRAVRAGLGAIAALHGLSEQLVAGGVLDSRLEARVGVHTGIVVVADLGSGRHAEGTAVVGATTSTAARLQQAALPGQVLVSEATYGLAKDAFHFVDFGSHGFKGVERPVHAYIATSELPLDARLSPASASHVPYINRTAELRSLLDAWRGAIAGASPVVIVEGEAGMGKSRLVLEFRRRIIEDGGNAATMICAEDDRASAFQPVAAWLRRRLGLLPDEAAEQARRKLLALIRQLHLTEADVLAPLSALLGCLSEAEAAVLTALPRRRRKRIIDALVSVVLADQRDEPKLLVLVDDVHWADDSTLTFLRALADRRAEHRPRAMLLMTMRPGLVTALPGHSPMVLRLEGLSQEAARELVEVVTPVGFAPRVLQQILARTGGVPLFVEEVARAAGTAVQSDDSIPMTLRGSLMAQLDRLGDAKPIAQLASVLGRSFRFDVLEAVSNRVAPAALRQSVHRLIEARFLDSEASPQAPEAYTFRHILIRDAAYESLLRQQRQAEHLRVAMVLRERFPQMVAARPELLARHLAAAGQNAEAAAAYEAAARQAMAQTAHVEAVEHCRAALSLLDHLPETRDHIEAEIRLNVLLAVQLTILRGNAEPEVLQAFERAHAAAERLGETWALFRTLRGLITYHLVRGNVAAGHAVSWRLMSLVRETTDPALLIQAHRAHGLALLYLGKFEAARSSFILVLKHYDPTRHASQRFEYGSDPGVLGRCHLGWIEWFQGNAARAEVESEAAITAARALDHPHSLAFALGFRACIGQFSGRPAVARATAMEMAQIARTHDFPYWAAWAEILQGWALARDGEVAAGEDKLRQGLRHYTDTGAELLSPYIFFLLADAIHQERRDEAVSLLDQALELSAAQSILFYQPETLRFKGELLIPTDPKQAAEILQQAVAVAEVQGAIATAKRAAGELALLREQRAVSPR